MGRSSMAIVERIAIDRELEDVRRMPTGNGDGSHRDVNEKTYREGVIRCCRY